MHGSDNDLPLVVETILTDWEEKSTPFVVAVETRTPARMAPRDWITALTYRILYTTPRVVEVRETWRFAKWLADLRDATAGARVAARIRRLALGNPGDVRPVGEGVSELRIDYGPGYRVYFVQRGSVVVVLLCGGDKRTQDRDIRIAKAMAADLEDE
jgi:putative addiction module killer protein